MCDEKHQSYYSRLTGIRSTYQKISVVEAVHEILTTAGENLVSSSHPCMSALSPDTVTVDPS